MLSVRLNIRLARCKSLLLLLAVFSCWSGSAYAATVYYWWDNTNNTTGTVPSDSPMLPGVQVTYVGSATLPDADKGEQTPSEGVYGGNNMCWAATASNQLWISGWGARGGFQNETEIFAQMISSYTDSGGFIYRAYRHFLGTEVETGTGSGPDVASISTAPNWYALGADTTHYTYGAATALTDIFTEFDAATAAGRYGLGIALVSSVGHAVNMWGYEIDDTQTPGTAAYYKAIYITDNQSDTTTVGDDVRRVTISWTGSAWLTSYSSYEIAYDYSLKTQYVDENPNTALYGEWRGGDSTWATTGNWSNWNTAGSDVPIDDTAVTFGDNATQFTVNPGADLNLARLIFNATNNYTIGNDGTYTLTLGGRLWTSDTGAGIVQNNSGTVTINSNIKLKESLYVADSSSVTVHSSSSYKIYGTGSGAVTVNGVISEVERDGTSAIDGGNHASLVKEGSFALTFTGANT